MVVFVVLRSTGLCVDQTKFSTGKILTSFKGMGGWRYELQQTRTKASKAVAKHSTILSDSGGEFKFFFSLLYVFRPSAILHVKLERSLFAIR